jgi:hypothetical protein
MYIPQTCFKLGTHHKAYFLDRNHFQLKTIPGNRFFDDNLTGFKNLIQCQKTSPNSVKNLRGNRKTMILLWETGLGLMGQGCYLISRDRVWISVARSISVKNQNPVLKPK